MSSLNDRSNIKDLMARIVKLNDSINSNNDRLGHITKDSSFPTEALAKEALSLNQQSLDDLISLQELIDSVDKLTKEDFDTCSKEIAKQESSVEKSRLDVESETHNYKKSRTSYYTSFAVLVSVFASSLFFIYFWTNELGENLFPYFITIGVIIISLASSYLSVRQARRSCDLANKVYELHRSHLEFLQEEMTFIEVQRTCLEELKSHAPHTLKCYKNMQSAVMDLYEVKFNG